MKIEFGDLLTILLVGLKLAGVIHISWWLVFTPMLIVLGILVVTLAIFGAVALRNKKLSGVK